jgi:hypothetical protein
VVAAAARLTREGAAVVAMSGAVSAAAIEVVAHRLPIIWATSQAPVAWQMAELWRMHFEKPLAVWQAWASLGAWPFAVAGLVARSAAARTPPETVALMAGADGAKTARTVLRGVHAIVSANARRLGRRRRRRR